MMHRASLWLSGIEMENCGAHMTLAMVHCAPESSQRLRGMPSIAMWRLIWHLPFAWKSRTDRYFLWSRFAVADRSDSIRPAIDRVTGGLAWPVRRGEAALLPIALDGGFSGVVFLLIAVFLSGS
jgi:hypothetical protein